jgi:hypothetical protein
MGDMWLIGHRVDILDCGLDSFVSMLGTVSPPPLPSFPHLLVHSSSKELDGKERSLNPSTEHTPYPSLRFQFSRLSILLGAQYTALKGLTLAEATLIGFLNPVIVSRPVSCHPNI